METERASTQAKAQIGTPHWARMGEETFIFGIWLLYWIHHVFGRLPFRICLFPVAAVHWALRPTLRFSSMQYLSRLQISTNALGHTPTWLDGIRHVVLFAETLLDKLLAVSGKYSFSQIARNTLSQMQEEIKVGRGGVIVTAHIGCLELCSALAEQDKEVRLNILTHTQNAEKFNQILKRLNPHTSLRLIEVSEITPATAVFLANCVAAGEFIVTTGDRVPILSKQFVHANFLGQKAAFPIGPYVLANLLKSPLFFLACIHTKSSYEIHFEKIAEKIQLPRGNRETAAEEYALCFANKVTELLKRSPYDWFNFFPFWDQGNINNE